MKLIDIVTLEHRHISAHKRQSILIVTTISLLFGAILGVISLFEGLEDLFIRSSDLISNNKIYLTVSSCTNGGACLEWNDIESLASKKAGSYGGRVVGKLSYYEYKNGGKSFYVVDEKFVESLLEIDLGEHEAGTLFKIISLDDAERLANGNSDEAFDTSSKIYSAAEIADLKLKVLGKEFKETYSVPKTSAETASVEESGESGEDADSVEPASEAEENAEYETKELSYIVAGVVGTNRTSMVLATKYDEVRLLDFFLKRADRNVVPSGVYVSLGSSTDYDTIFETAKSVSSTATVADLSVPILEFSNLNDAYDFYKTENCALERNLEKCSSFTVDEFIGNRLQTMDALDTLYIIFRFLGTILLLIAVTISVFTFMRLISENAQSIALYRSLGASTSDIFFIYFFYLFELCCATIVVATILGFAVAAALSLKNAEGLTAIFTSVYGRSITPGILFGFSREVAHIFLATIATAPLCSILTVDQLSTKNIAKRIRSGSQ